MKTGQIIFSLRKNKQLTQDQLAKAIGVSQKSIDYWEREINEPKASYIIALADFFKISADEILGRENDIGIVEIIETKLSPGEQSIIDFAKQLSPQEQQTALQILTAAFPQKTKKGIKNEKLYNMSKSNK